MIITSARIKLSGSGTGSGCFFGLPGLPAAFPDGFSAEVLAVLPDGFS